MSSGERESGVLNLGICRKEAWSFYRTTSGVRLCWELEEAKGPQGQLRMTGYEASKIDSLKPVGTLRAQTPKQPPRGRVWVSRL